MNAFLDFMAKHWGWILSVLTLVGGLVVYVYSRIKALQLGVQALLRAQMITYYYQYHDGKTPLHVRESFDNCWHQYEKLGANGVMKDIYDKFMALPISDQ